MIKGVIFDIDDTLYLEKDYVKSGFTAVSRYIEDKTSIDRNTMFDSLWQAFLDGVRRNTFNLLLENHPALVSHFTIHELVDVYRNHEPSIQLLPEVRRLLINLRNKGYRLGIVSDGFLQSQQLKVRALGLEKLVDTIQLTDKWGREYWKPHPRGFEACAKELGVRHNELCYIADNTEKDFVSPRQLGWFTIHAMVPGQQYKSSRNILPSAKPDHVIVDFNKALLLIEQRNQSVGEV